MYSKLVCLFVFLFSICFQAPTPTQNKLKTNKTKKTTWVTQQNGGQICIEIGLTAENFAQTDSMPKILAQGTCPMQIKLYSLAKVKGQSFLKVCCIQKVFYLSLDFESSPGPKERFE